MLPIIFTVQVLVVLLASIKTQQELLHIFLLAIVGAMPEYKKASCSPRIIQLLLVHPEILTSLMSRQNYPS